MSIEAARTALLGLAVGDAFGTMLDGYGAREELGTGSNITAYDTAPFAIWCAVRCLASYEDALWTVCAHPGLDFAPNAMTLFALDRDTLGAITGGIVACAVGEAGIPLLWREATERLPGVCSTR